MYPKNKDKIRQNNPHPHFILHIYIAKPICCPFVQPHVPLVPTGRCRKFNSLVWNHPCQNQLPPQISLLQSACKEDLQEYFSFPGCTNTSTQPQLTCRFTHPNQSG